ncbi:beta-ketoacyl synthase [bacterium]|nr:beta-ketoacyl synthase [bacterium]
MKDLISITAISSISPIGTSLSKIWDTYQDDEHLFTKEKISETTQWVARLPEFAKKEILELRTSDLKYKNLDESVLFALYASRNAVRAAGWTAKDNFGVNLGSSRGATGLFEKYHTEFVQSGKTATLTSPTTTLGNISSWVAHDLQTNGPELSHSITCSTALHSLLNGVAWLRANMAEKFLVGGSEAPLTPFTLAQMNALKIYAKTDSDYPCQALELKKKRNTMILGEGASVACLEKGISRKTLAMVEGVGYATEILKHNISISADALCFQKSMKMALGELSPDTIDIVVMHAPGTIKGDISEFSAIEKVFSNKKPFLTTNKWKLGHTFGASGMFSVELAVLMLTHQKAIKVPFVSYTSPEPKKIKRIMVNAVGFGGNAVSILLTK